MSYKDILQSAIEFQLANKERNVATWLRGYKEPKPSERFSAENVGLRVVLDLATLAGELFEVDGRKDAIVNALGRILGNSYRPEADYSTSYFASLAALTFASAGNFASAKVLASSTLHSSNLDSTERWMMEILSDRKIKLSRRSTPNILVSYAQLTDHALRSGNSKDFEQATKEFLRANKEDSQALTSSDKGLLLLWEQVHARFEELSVAKVLRDIAFPHQAYAKKLLESSSLFYPSQVYALLNYPLIQPGKTVIISLPTSTGKTLLGELALVSSLTWQPRKHWLSVYIAPYRALTTQIMRDMRKRLNSAGILCDMRRGGYLSEEPLQPGRPTVIVATPEAFDGLLRRKPELYSCLAGCVFDEFHLIEQMPRGIRYEGLLGRFLRGASGEDWPKIVALSPVVEDTISVESWLQANATVKNEWKPTSRRIAIVHHNKTIDYYTPSEKLPADSDTQIVWQEHLPISAVNVINIALDQFERFNQEPVLIVANTRGSTRELALELQLSFYDRVLSKEHPAFRSAEKIIQRYPYLYTLHKCLKYGVAYHNAALPSWVRGELEKLIEDKHLRFVISTTTLAEGVDFPFRVVVLEDWSQLWQFGQPQPMSRLLVRNIAGRGGRAWAYTEGDTILIDTERNINTTALEQYVQPVSYRLKSSIQRVIEIEGEERPIILLDSWAVTESQFIAFLSACGDQGNVEQEFSGSLYAGQDQEVGYQIDQVTMNLVEDSINASRPVMQRQSPLSLTDFGEVILKTGLSPRSGMALANFIETYDPITAPPEGSQRRSRYGIEWISLVARLWQALLKESEKWIRELRTYRFRQIGRNQFPVRESDFTETAMAWVSGVPMEAMGYLTLRDLKDISKQDVQTWLNKQREFPPRGFEGWLEKLSNDFCGNYLSHSWSWVFRGGVEICGYLKNEASDLQRNDLVTHYEDLGLEFEKLALRLEFGVSDTQVAEWLRQHCPIDRAKLDTLMKEYKNQPPMFAIDTFIEWLREKRKSLINFQVGPFPVVRVSEDDVNRLEKFLSDLGD
jgi:helicase